MAKGVIDIGYIDLDIDYVDKWDTYIADLDIGVGKVGNGNTDIGYKHIENKYSI